MEGKSKSLELERLVFFSDAVVAIAITLLALDLKLEVGAHEELTFAAIGHAWEKFAAFFLSFLYIAIFWLIHHRFFTHIKTIDNRMLWYNLGWLLFIVTLPFSTALVSAHVFDVAAVSTYCFNTLMITLFQNQIWDHVAVRPDYLKNSADKKLIYDNRVSCNVAMINALLALLASAFNPVAAYVILILRLPMIEISQRVFRYEPRKRHHTGPHPPPPMPKA